ncbi:glucosaminidase domain-containing protein [Rhodovibrionaceae bacterium A322]
MVEKSNTQQDKPRRKVAGLLVATALVAAGVVAAVDLLRVSLKDAAQEREEAQMTAAVPALTQGRLVLTSTTAIEHSLNLTEEPVQEPAQLAAIVEHDTVEDLNAYFEAVNFYLPEVREGDSAVPRLYVTGLPRDLAEVGQVEDRKKAFLRTLLPLVLLANEEIESRRSQLDVLQARLLSGTDLSIEDRGWLDALADYYGTDHGDLQQLRLRVDSIPVSLALAQGIVESGWGTSRFAQQGNALFGQRVWKKDAEGIVPEKAAHVKVQSFDDLMESVRAYMHNLNTHPAYSELRDRRAAWRDQGSQPAGYNLASALTLYAEAKDYPSKLKSLMRSNNLAELEEAVLESGLVAQSASTAYLIGGDG